MAVHYEHGTGVLEVKIQYIRFDSSYKQIRYDEQNKKTVTDHIHPVQYSAYTDYVDFTDYDTCLRFASSTRLLGRPNFPINGRQLMVSKKMLENKPYSLGQARINSNFSFGYDPGFLFV